VNKENVN